ncbi:cysteine hydrolase family protein [Bacillus sp. EAC]|uniref:cysteine hydrolase family protein n=1 Tax=Bacillus sp. EAC TaxID=1978338 RepID=UPI000B44C826|nr:cysteine hydrolase family protein [Bacillus sp. EAC]
MEKKALLIIDVQVGMFPEDEPVYNGEKLLQNINQLLDKARTSNTPIFYIQHNESEGPLVSGTKGWEIHPDIAPSETDLIIQKHTPDSFLRTNLNEELQKREITHLIMAGIQTEACVDTTTRIACSSGYDVTLITDAHSTWDSQDMTAQQIINHHNNVLRWFGNTKTTSEVEF